MKEPKAQDLIRGAIALAGKPKNCAAALSVTPQAISLWGVHGRVPLDKVHQLCALGGNTIRPEAILAAMAREAAEKAAA